jgi:dTDP-4-dehydrorhamnose 3,5-epimerase
MNIIQTGISGLVVFEPQVFDDERGFFLETYRQDVLLEAGIDKMFVQDNHSRSSKGTLRGLHYQLTQPQGKLVRVSSGSVFDVAVDVRLGSPTFGQWHGEILDSDDKKMMYIPHGFAHGFLVLTESADFIYKCTDYYHPQSEQGVLWNDADININWPIENVLLSEKDKNNVLLKEIPEHLLPRLGD